MLSVRRVAMVVLLYRAVRGCSDCLRGRVPLEDVPGIGPAPVTAEAVVAPASRYMSSRWLASRAWTKRFMMSKFCWMAPMAWL